MSAATPQLQQDYTWNPHCPEQALPYLQAAEEKPPSKVETPLMELAHSPPQVWEGIEEEETQNLGRNAHGEEDHHQRKERV